MAIEDWFQGLYETALRPGEMVIEVHLPKSAPGIVTSGSTWRFQFWYRDPGGATGSNFSSDLVVTFCP